MPYLFYFNCIERPCKICNKHFKMGKLSFNGHQKWRKPATLDGWQLPSHMSPSGYQTQDHKNEKHDIKPLLQSNCRLTDQTLLTFAPPTEDSRMIQFSYSIHTGHMFALGLTIMSTSIHHFHWIVKLLISFIVWSIRCTGWSKSWPVTALLLLFFYLHMGSLTATFAILLYRIHFTSIHCHFVTVKLSILVNFPFLLFVCYLFFVYMNFSS